MKITVKIQSKFNQKVFIVCLFCTFLFANPQANDQWIPLSSGVYDDLYGVCFLDENTGFATGWGVSYGGVILKTVNGGANWTSTIPVSGSYIFGITFINDSTGFVAGSDAGSTFYAMILKTTDGGNSWLKSLYSDSYGFYIIDFPTSTIGYACGYLGAIYKTVNGGNSWYRLPAVNYDTFRLMHFIDANTGYAVCGVNFNHPDKIYKTINGGSNWTLVKSFGNSMVVGGICFFDADSGVIVGHNGNEAILKTYDGGVNWEVKHSGTPSDVLQTLHFNGSNGWAAGNSGRIIKSTDYGETWGLDAATVPAPTHLGIYDIGEAAYVVGSSGKIFKKDLTTGIQVKEENLIPNQTTLYQNYPNPFNPETTIKYTLKKNHMGIVNIAVYDINGRHIRTLVNEVQRPGSYNVTFNAEDLASGIYYYGIITKDFKITKKMILIR